MKPSSKLIKEIKKNFMGPKVTKEGNSKFWGTDELHEVCIHALERMSVEEKLSFLVEIGMIDENGNDPVNPFGEP